MAWDVLILLITACSPFLIVGHNGKVLVDRLEKEKYFKFEQVSSNAIDSVVIATYKQTSPMQCRHRCNLNISCVDVVVKSGGPCMLLGNGNKRHDTDDLDGMKIIKKMKAPLPGKTSYLS